MASNRRSRNITQGVERAPNRSMFYGMGYSERDFDNPMIGVANGHSTITPCNAGLPPLADAAAAALKDAGANAQMFGTPTISDGMSMGTEGMKYSLVSREVIADCIETCVGGQWMDGVLVIGGCDKNMPGGMMGMLRAKNAEQRLSRDEMVRSSAELDFARLGELYVRSTRPMTGLRRTDTPVPRSLRSSPGGKGPGLVISTMSSKIASRTGPVPDP